MANQLHMQPKENLVRLGHISSAQGLKGDVRIHSETENPLDICNYGILWDAMKEKSFSLKFKHMHKGKLICHIDNIDNRNEAEALHGMLLCVEREKLPQLEEDEYYYSDLEGLDVLNISGEKIAIIKAVQDFGAGTMLDIILLADRRSIYIPFTEVFVPEVNISQNFVKINPAEDMLEPVKSGSRRRSPKN